MGLILARFAIDALTWLCSYETRSSMLVRIKEEVFAYAQRLSSAYFESTLSGKIAHRAIMLPDQVLMLFDMMVFELHSEHFFLLFVAGVLLRRQPGFLRCSRGQHRDLLRVSLLVGRECTGARR